MENLKNLIQDYAKDIRVNLGNVISSGATGLSEQQAYGIALASAYAVKNKSVIENILAEAQTKLSAEQINAAKTAASLMAMNNIYYRFTHLVSDEEYQKMPAGLRMQGIANHGIDKLDFELYSLAVSAINGCGMCMDSHAKSSANHGATKQMVQSAVKIGAVIAAAAQAVEIG
ncbi:MAG: carboxymuconolactone decarboxylase family protein [Rickettsiales bacterium]|nr:carboxymuconolactone decarboxylase family protein [Rickettsiales bacterium]